MEEDPEAFESSIEKVYRQKQSEKKLGNEKKQKLKNTEKALFDFEEQVDDLSQVSERYPGIKNNPRIVHRIPTIDLRLPSLSPKRRGSQYLPGNYQDLAESIMVSSTNFYKSPKRDIQLPLNQPVNTRLINQSSEELLEKSVLPASLACTCTQQKTQGNSPRNDIADIYPALSKLKANLKNGQDSDKQSFANYASQVLPTFDHFDINSRNPASKVPSFVQNQITLPKLKMAEVPTNKHQITKQIPHYNQLSQRSRSNLDIISYSKRDQPPKPTLYSNRSNQDLLMLRLRQPEGTSLKNINNARPDQISIKVLSKSNSTKVNLASRTIDQEPNQIHLPTDASSRRNSRYLPLQGYQIPAFTHLNSIQNIPILQKNNIKNAYSPPKSLSPLQKQRERGPNGSMRKKQNLRIKKYAPTDLNIITEEPAQRNDRILKLLQQAPFNDAVSTFEVQSNQRLSRFKENFGKSIPLPNSYRGVQLKQRSNSIYS